MGPHVSPDQSRARSAVPRSPARGLEVGGEGSMRRLVIVGQRALASPEFLLEDVAGTSGRLDVLLRALRAALLVSHGLRADSVAYLVLLGGPRAPRTLRFEGASARFLRPDEHNLAVLVRKVLAGRTPTERYPAVGPAVRGFAPFRAGIALAEGGLDAVLGDPGGAPPTSSRKGLGTSARPRSGTRTRPSSSGTTSASTTRRGRGSRRSAPSPWASDRCASTPTTPGPSSTTSSIAARRARPRSDAYLQLPASRSPA